jgi:hypothetical protein
VLFLQQQPIVIDVIKQPPPARDISIDVVLGMFQMTGVALLAAAVGGLIVGLILIGIRRMRAASAAPESETENPRLRI